MHYKDKILNQLADRANVAQFVSFAPNLEQRYSRIFTYENNCRFETLQQAIAAILDRSVEKSVNIRSFDPADPKSREFIYGLKKIEEVQDSVQRLAKSGLYTIINETIDICDGGVSGVALGDVIEFAPQDTPRCVEKPGTAALPRQLGSRLLETVYGFAPSLDYPSRTRVEFSIHPLRRGFRNEHTIIWELEELETGHEARTEIVWPNNFSRFIGDKAYGLLIAHLFDLPVADTTVIGRNVAPFHFGRATGSYEKWIRTCPAVQVPGKFTTKHGWCDPFKLMAIEDPEGKDIVSILSQASVEALYSGALVVSDNKQGTEEILIEGTRGFGEEFMTGQKKPTSLPDEIIQMVQSLYRQAATKLGTVRMEWVADREQVWIVQLHRGAVKSSGRTIYPGSALSYRKFDVELGLEALRGLVSTINSQEEGIILVGNIGITSHFGDVLRRAKIPSKIEVVEAS
jgi:hypothetical protein